MTFPTASAAVRFAKPGDPIKGVTVNGEPVEASSGESIGDILQRVLGEHDRRVLAALVRNRCVDLSHPVYDAVDITTVDYTSREGVLVYRHTASIVLLEAARQLFPGKRITIGQALGNGYFYQPDFGGDFTREQMLQLEKKVRELVAQDVPIETETVTVEHARRRFEQDGQIDKVRLLRTYWEPFITVVRCGRFCDIHRYPVAPSAGYIKSFQFEYRPPGLIFRFPPRGKARSIGPYYHSPKLFNVYAETREWNRITGVEAVGQLNELIIKGQSKHLVHVTEGLHDKKIVKIAEQISTRPEKVRLVLIAGPSSSGKTTFAKRLSLQLRVNGVTPIALSLDDFYVNREDTPRDADGNYDFESIEAIDLTLFNDVLTRLLDGEQVHTPKFNFVTGLREPKSKWNTLKLEADQVLVVEGIHGLNERLTSSVSPRHKFKVYVSALTQLCIDDHNRIFTSDTRFLRRIVRDRHFRGYSAQTTIETWPRVRRGEQRNIFPFQEEADVMFNSALVYEQSLLRPYAERFLLEVPQNSPAFADAYRLLKFIQNFVPVFEEYVPQISILREFIGGSGFHY